MKPSASQKSTQTTTESAPAAETPSPTRTGPTPAGGSPQRPDSLVKGLMGVVWLIMEDKGWQYTGEGWQKWYGPYLAACWGSPEWKVDYRSAKDEAIKLRACSRASGSKIAAKKRRLPPKEYLRYLRRRRESVIDI